MTEMEEGEERGWATKGRVEAEGTNRGARGVVYDVSLFSQLEKRAGGFPTLSTRKQSFIHLPDSQEYSYILALHPGVNQSPPDAYTTPIRTTFTSVTSTILVRKISPHSNQGNFRCNCDLL